jgi:hypothetical protein
MLDAGCRMLDARGSMMDARCWMSNARFLMLDERYDIIGIYHVAEVVKRIVNIHA